MNNGQIEPRQLFGSKLGLILGAAGKDKFRYTIIYKIKPVREMMIRYGVCHKACAKKHITKDDSIMMIDIGCGLFGLDKSGMLRRGEVSSIPVPPNLKFDGFRGIELLNRNKYRVWQLEPTQLRWEPKPDETVMRVNPKTNKVEQHVKKNIYTYYPFKEALMDMSGEILHDAGTMLIPATEAVDWMKTWLKRMQGKRVMMDELQITTDTMGAGAVNK